LASQEDGISGKPVRGAKAVLLRMWASLPRVVMLLKRVLRAQMGDLERFWRILTRSAMGSCGTGVA
jgi:hypothetical protein